jgi:hypothetical protein
MTAQAQWFCDADEERTILDRLTENETIAVFDLDGQRMTEIPDFSVEKLPPWPTFVGLYLWAKELGPLRWHENCPKVDDATHRALVMRLFAREDWDQSSLGEGDRLLDQDLSPGLCYKRPEMWKDRIGPCTLIAPPSSLERVGARYAKWTKRCIAWIRRRGKIVHDWRSPSETIPNPHQFLNTVYAFPSAMKLLVGGVHSFVFL